MSASASSSLSTPLPPGALTTWGVQGQGIGPGRLAALVAAGPPNSRGLSDVRSGKQFGRWRKLHADTVGPGRRWRPNPIFQRFDLSSGKTTR